MQQTLISGSDLYSIRKVYQSSIIGHIILNRTQRTTTIKIMGLVILATIAGIIGGSSTIGGSQQNEKENDMDTTAGNGLRASTSTKSCK